MQSSAPLAASCLLHAIETGPTSSECQLLLAKQNPGQRLMSQSQPACYEAATQAALSSSVAWSASYLLKASECRLCRAVAKSGMGCAALQGTASPSVSEASQQHSVAQLKARAKMAMDDDTVNLTDAIRISGSARLPPGLTNLLRTHLTRLAVNESNAANRLRNALWTFAALVQCGAQNIRQPHFRTVTKEVRRHCPDGPPCPKHVPRDVHAVEPLPNRTPLSLSRAPPAPTSTCAVLPQTSHPRPYR